MIPPKKKRPLKKARHRKRTGLFNPLRFLSYTLLLMLLVFSVCAVGYVIFFRTVVAQEIPPALRGEIVFEEPDPPVQSEDVAVRPLPDQAVEAEVKEAVVSKKTDLPKVAIIIDDMGYNELIGEQLLRFPIELTLSFLPFAPHTRKLERLAHRAGKTVFLHLPLEPKDSTFNPGCGALYLQDSPETQREKFANALQEVSHAVGVNNHMGSRFTEDRPAMANIMQEIKERSLMFVDSFTTPGSVGLQTARQAGINSIGRSVFLDNVLDEEKICHQLEQLVILSERNGRAIGIGHPHRETVSAIAKCSEKYQTRVHYVGVREVTLYNSMTNNDIFTLDNQKMFELVLSRAKDSISTELDGETVILDIASGIYSGLDSMGTFIWDQLEHPVSVATLRDAILEKYDVTEEKCVADLLVFLKDLADNALILFKNE